MQGARVLGGDSTWHEVQSASSRAWDEKIRRLGPSARPNPQLIAVRGKRIYEERYRKQYEPRYHGQFVAIDVDSGHTYFGDTPNEAYLQDSIDEFRSGGSGDLRITGLSAASAVWQCLLS